ncbi:molybdenum cofactor guanylyltransferase MobA [Thiohalobacter sp. IOR34]|uniref:molybdenum cofactor guanylyltransferase MobA n=1 Tax=Thiohalobacter sp. IOR34 TaxID=3057176 RepID=UPI0025B0EC2F|nr:molybdenum cofactor guanylyltransferase MobA [Thiohalobacter sp. IOR34]WJW74759.1 molybdenum cofactor guanylyltransferase MobA [Thiohalobacter sp. IOR34]
MPTASPTSPAHVTGLILAGGRATRMGGRDKGLIELAGRPLIDYALAAMDAVCEQVLISANRHLDLYRRFGRAVLSDPLADYPGPLAGILAGLQQAPPGVLLVMPCDTPLATPALLQRLVAAGTDTATMAAVAHDGQRLQPAFVRLDPQLARPLRQALEAGERRLGRWVASLDPRQVDCSDHPEWFDNINTPEDLDALAARLAETP